MHLVLVTGNAHKVEELAAALPGHTVERLALAAEPAENGARYVDNARIKALAGRPVAPAGAWVVGEDSGIEVAALGGAPGIQSARWADDGVARLLQELGGEQGRTARYVCVIVASGPSGDELVAEGTLDGAIAEAPRGLEGFGYDPIFVPRGETLTVAELGDAWKRIHSHRARAADALRRALASVRPP